MSCSCLAYIGETQYIVNSSMLSRGDYGIVLRRYSLRVCGTIAKGNNSVHEVKNRIQSVAYFSSCDCAVYMVLFLVLVASQ